MAQFALITSSEKVCHSSQVSTPTTMPVYQSLALQRLSQPPKHRDLMFGTRLHRGAALWGGGHCLPRQAVFTERVNVVSVALI